MPAALIPILFNPAFWAAVGEATLYVGSAVAAGYVGSKVLQSVTAANEDAEEKAKPVPIPDVATCATGECPPQQSPECRQSIENMREKTNKFINEMKKYNAISDAAGGHSYMLNGVMRTTVPGGHYQEIRDLQRGLKNELETYNKKKCYSNASKGEKAVRNQAQQTSSQNVEVPPGIPFIPL
jgi:hypothetical protein